jgi:hypothetical protein
MEKHYEREHEKESILNKGDKETINRSRSRERRADTHEGGVRSRSNSRERIINSTHIEGENVEMKAILASTLSHYFCVTFTDGPWIICSDGLLHRFAHEAEVPVDGTVRVEHHEMKVKPDSDSTETNTHAARLLHIEMNWKWAKVVKPMSTEFRPQETDWARRVRQAIYYDCDQDQVTDHDTAFEKFLAYIGGLGHSALENLALVCPTMRGNCSFGATEAVTYLNTGIQPYRIGGVFGTTDAMETNSNLLRDWATTHVPLKDTTWWNKEHKANKHFGFLTVTMALELFGAYVAHTDQTRIMTTMPKVAILQFHSPSSFVDTNPTACWHIEILKVTFRKHWSQ